MRPQFRHFLYASASASMLLSGAAFAQSSQGTEAPPPGVQPQPLGGNVTPTTTGNPADAQAVDDGGLEDIVVTAQKREQNLQDVPVSISALGETAIIANKIQDVTDLGRVTPNLTVRESAGGAQLPQYVLRGIYTFGSTAGTDKGVSLYIDGVYVQSAAGSIFEFADIQRIEVLRGPQGTLFGRNATGGAISVITRDPTGEFGVRQDFTVGNLGQVRSKTRVDLPQVGPFSVTASYLHSERDGEVRNLGAGTTFDYGPATGGKYGRVVSPRRLGDSNVEGVFAAVNMDFHPDLSLKYKFDYSENDFTPTAVGLSTYLPGAAAAAFGGFAPPAGTQAGGSNITAFATVQALYNAQPAALRTPLSRTRPDAVNNEFTLPGRSKAWGHNLTAQYSITDDLSIKNILAYRKSTLLTFGYQLDGMGGLRVAGGLPFALVVNNSTNDQRQWSNEFQVNYDSSFLTLTAGAIHFQDKQTTAGIDNTFNVLQFSPVFGQNTPAVGTAFVIPQNTGYRQIQVKTKSDALFTQGEFHVTDMIDLVGGIRVTRDRKDGLEPFPGTGPAFTSQQQQAAAGAPGSLIRYRDTRETYLIGVNYKPSNDLLFYAKYVTGFISGGQIATISFAPETARSLEGGVKADLLNRRLRSNLALFHVNYGAIQQATLGALAGIPSAAPFATAIIPSADARAYGFEWENTLAPVDGVVLQGNVGYTDFDYRGNLFPGFVFTSGAPGVQEFQRPKWTVNVSGQYETPEIIAGGRLLVRADAAWKSRTLLSNDVSPGAGPNAREDPALRIANTTPASWTVNGRLALQGVEVGGSKLTVAAFGKNIFNNRNILQSTGLGFQVPVIYERARTYGLDVSIEF